MSNEVRIGIAGAGAAAEFHLASYRKVYGENFKILGICGRNPDRVSQLSEKFGIPRQFDSMDVMLKAPEIDAVDICLPNHLHFQLVRNAADRGKHIICEKPLGGYFGPIDADELWDARGFSRQKMLDFVLEQAEATEDIIKRSGVTFCYGENWVYAPPIAKVNRLMAASRSTIMRIEGEQSHSGSHSTYAMRWRTAGGGSLLRLCVHPIGAALFLKYEEGRRRTGNPIRPKSITARVANLTDIQSFKADLENHMVVGWNDVEDWATIIVTFEDGSVAQLTSTDTRLGGIKNYLSASGSHAIAIANINPNDMCQAYAPNAKYFSSEYLVEKTETKEGWSFPAPDEDAVTGYPEELRDFVGAISRGYSPKSDLALAVDVLLVVYAGYLSAEQGATINLKEFM